MKGRATCKFRALYDACSVGNIPRGVLGTRVNPKTCRIRVDGQIRFESGYVWTWKFLNWERKSCGLKSIPILLLECLEEETKEQILPEKGVFLSFFQEVKKAIFDDILLKGKEAKLNSFEQVCTLSPFKEGIITEVAQKSSSAHFSQIIHIPFFRISAHALISALPRLSAHPLGHSIIKQAPLSNKVPSPQLPSLSQIVEMQDERVNLHIIEEDDLEETRLNDILKTYIPMH